MFRLQLQRIRRPLRPAAGVVSGRQSGVSVVMRTLTTPVKPAGNLGDSSFSHILARLEIVRQNALRLNVKESSAKERNNRPVNRGNDIKPYTAGIKTMPLPKSVRSEIKLQTNSKIKSPLSTANVIPVKVIPEKGGAETSKPTTSPIKGIKAPVTNTTPRSSTSQPHTSFSRPAEEDLHTTHWVQHDKSVYAGELLQGRKHGSGTRATADGTVYKGKWQHDAMHGSMKIRFPDGKVFAGTFENNRLVPGTGMFVHDDQTSFNSKDKVQFRSSPHQKAAAKMTVTPQGAVSTALLGQAFEEVQHTAKGLQRYAIGSVYDGAYMKNRMEGQGTLTCPDGSSYTGHWHQDLRTLQGTGTGSDGTVYSGEWRENSVTGRGTYTYPCGGTLTGDFVHGTVYNGSGMVRDSTGGVYVGQWERGYKHGSGEYKCDRYTYTGAWVNGQREGHGVLQHSDGAVYTGYFLNDLYHGQGSVVATNPEHYHYTGEYKEGLPHGTGREEHVGSGTVYEGTYQQGKFHGAGKITYTDGTTVEGTFIDGKLQGQAVRIQPDGTVHRGWFNNTRMKGEIIYPNGEKFVGVVRDLTPFNGTGTVRTATTTYVGEVQNSLWHGNGVYTFADGRVYDGMWKAGKMHGTGVLHCSAGSASGEFRENSIYNGSGVIMMNDKKVWGKWVDGKRHFDYKVTEKLGLLEHSAKDKDGKGSKGDKGKKDRNVSAGAKRAATPVKKTTVASATSTITNTTATSTTTTAHTDTAAATATAASTDNTATNATVTSNSDTATNTINIITTVDTTTPTTTATDKTTPTTTTAASTTPLLNGPGTLTLPSGRILTGTFANGILQGIGTMNDPDKEITYKGMFHNNEPHGQGELESGKGNKWTGTFVDGKIHGFGKQSMPDGGYYEGMFSNAVYHGFGKSVKDGYSYEGEHVYGKKHGHGTLKREGFFTFEGRWRNDKREGFGVNMNLLTNTVYKGVFSNNEYHGPGTITSDHGTYSGNFVYGERHGKGVYAGYGVKVTGEWTHNRLDGIATIAALPDTSTTTTTTTTATTASAPKTARDSATTNDTDITTTDSSTTNATNTADTTNTNTTNTDTNTVRGLFVLNSLAYQVTDNETIDRKVDKLWELLPDFKSTDLFAPERKFYIGEMQNKRRHGYGRNTFIDGRVYTGMWKEGLMHGKGVLECSAGSVSGEFREGKIYNGKGVVIDDRGTIFDGTWVEGVKVGPLKITFPSGVVLNTFGGDEKGEQTGQNKQQATTTDEANTAASTNTTSSTPSSTTFTNPSSRTTTPRTTNNTSNNNTYIGEKKGNVPHGRGKMVRNGESWEGTFVDGQFTGVGIYRNVNSFVSNTITSSSNTWGDNGASVGGANRISRARENSINIGDQGTVYVGHFLNFAFSGKGKLHTNGRIYEGMFQENELHGYGQCIDEIGIYEGEWYKGRRHGAGSLVQEGGSVVEGVWFNNVLQQTAAKPYKLQRE